MISGSIRINPERRAGSIRSAGGHFCKKWRKLRRNYDPDLVLIVEECWRPLFFYNKHQTIFAISMANVGTPKTQKNWRINTGKKRLFVCKRSYKRGQFWSEKGGPAHQPLQKKTIDLGTRPAEPGGARWSPVKRRKRHPLGAACSPGRALPRFTSLWRARRANAGRAENR